MKQSGQRANWTGKDGSYNIGKKTKMVRACFAHGR